MGGCPLHYIHCILYLNATYIAFTIGADVLKRLFYFTFVYILRSITHKFQGALLSCITSVRDVFLHRYSNFQITAMKPFVKIIYGRLIMIK